MGRCVDILTIFFAWLNNPELKARLVGIVLEKNNIVEVGKKLILNGKNYGYAKISNCVEVVGANSCVQWP